MAELIRPARIDDLAALSDLAFRSKAHCGYDEAFMEACRDELTVRPADLDRFHVFVLERDGAMTGFAALAPGLPESELWWLFVEPAAIGSGAGRTLWHYAIDLARTLGSATLRIESNPNAEAFYLAMGATRVGEAPSQSIPGRSIPLLEFDLDASRDTPEKANKAMNNESVRHGSGMLDRPDGPDLGDDEPHDTIRDAASKTAAEKNAHSLPGNHDDPFEQLAMLRARLALGPFSDEDLEELIAEARRERAERARRNYPESDPFRTPAVEQ